MLNGNIEPGTFNLRWSDRKSWSVPHYSAMIKVQHWLETGKLQSILIMQVHDELVLEVPQVELHLVKDMLPKLMCGVAELQVPLLVELGEGRNWDEAH